MGHCTASAPASLLLCRHEHPCLCLRRRPNGSSATPVFLRTRPISGPPNRCFSTPPPRTFIDRPRGGGSAHLGVCQGLLQTVDGRLQPIHLAHCSLLAHLGSQVHRVSVLSSTWAAAIGARRAAAALTQRCVHSSRMDLTFSCRTRTSACSKRGGWMDGWVRMGWMDGWVTTAGAATSSKLQAEDSGATKRNPGGSEKARGACRGWEPAPHPHPMRCPMRPKMGMVVRACCAHLELLNACLGCSSS